MAERRGLPGGAALFERANGDSMGGYQAIYYSPPPDAYYRAASDHRKDGQATGASRHGNSCAPVVDGDRIFVSAGGTNGAGVNIATPKM